MGNSLSKRSNAEAQLDGLTSSQAIAILYHIAIVGEYVASDVHFPLEILTADDIAAACNRLNEEDYNCYWCGVKLAFLQESGFNQFSPDLLFDAQYFEVGQRTVRSFTHCQFLFNDASVIEREEMIDELLSNKYRPDFADKALELYEMNTNDDETRGDGIIRSSKYRIYS